MFSVVGSEYEIRASVDSVLPNYLALTENCELHDNFGLQGPDGKPLVIGVRCVESKWPELVVSQLMAHGSKSGFHPSVAIVPETHCMFVGCGDRLLAYDLSQPRRLWEDHADGGFRGWSRYRDRILMSTELEFACWDTTGGKRWTLFVERPWDFNVLDGTVSVEWQWHATRFDIDQGPDE